MRLQYFTQAFVERLRDSAGENVGFYGPSSEWIASLADRHSAVRESNEVVGPPPRLFVDPDEKTQHDATNARLVYSWLSGLTPVLAMEERLWAYLSHMTFASYMSTRWPVDDAGVVHRRYLFEGRSFSALARNGIARLWWAGYLTCDPQRDDPFELTGTLFLRQDIQTNLLERAMGKSRSVRTAVLEYFRDNAQGLSEKSFGRRIQILLRELNLLGGTTILDALPPEEIRAFLDSTGARLISED